MDRGPLRSLGVLDYRGRVIMMHREVAAHLYTKWIWCFVHYKAGHLCLIMGEYPEILQ